MSLLIGDGRGNPIGVIESPDSACARCGWTLGANTWCLQCAMHAADEASKRFRERYDSGSVSISAPLSGGGDP